ncbi:MULTISPECIES: type II toxin-antitoxin system HipA family toxin [Empedobacter]|uniref:type II toxin-antitoxin system HipA family toxin n=1 Tax=Empedobacter TaxID=59734 RepID=UPI0025779FBA|nr:MULTISPECIES: HipA domain-containing protein [Empedobacter]MDM1043061.1 HipA domain-containing protein [Empedobacter brevis]MDM1136972.1 HipA domain-containing protein [Empedobacter sp. R750]
MKIELNNCPGSLKENFNTYSSTVVKKMFNGKKVDPILNYTSPTDRKDKSSFNQNQTHISISGFQEKYSLILDGNELRLTNEIESGLYILKPISDLPKNSEFAPANEHLTMQIAKQIFKIETAENVLVFFEDGSPAYLTKRFDYNENGEKLAVEDFASLLGKSPATDGEQYKYEGNYLELFDALKKYVPAWKIEAPKLYTLIVFNYLFSNGDAHLKNFSLIETQQGDFKLSPAYDLLNTKIHIDDSDFALKEGLLPKSISKGKIIDQLFLLGENAKMTEKSIIKVIQNLSSKEDQVVDLIGKSYLSEKLKRNYLQSYQRRLKKLRIVID